MEFSVMKSLLKAVGCVFVAGVLIAPTSAQFQIATAGRDFSYTISTTQPWTDTGVDLQAGDVMQIHASSAETCDPAGVSSVASSGLPLVSAPAGALIARLQAQGMPILIGSGKQLRSEAAGHLYLRVNAAGTPPCSGTFAVKVHIDSAAAPVAGSSLTSNAAPAATPSSTTPVAASKPGTASSETGKTAPAQDIKSKLASAAQVFLAGQFGNGAAASPASSAAAPTGNDVVTPNSTPTESTTA